ncbi:uncharacterized protein LOC119098438 [Pollicipes pollicipes]|uniref:uncharacterized protein LOC119098438 n=1 Tax=Pollicipes pollicipes TaxID=41117 RepID=UPI00188496D5|nr:uncharacterized protein LOC119098438 [Pollicipes pollicipes]XP_037077248.1 uncharacterized protein LOC119098438 [Pollicipes pollicipes]XP_037077249.1 uncharacterized protein LOC119098438 [Pollicipes pollicipes]XP_037077250.1 uncharacterized protein LOC119098438 [Pollicipes pollicipes]XP_037077251.1 uncharacterized protein LOC119098438 [Pollicipes pollicipes]XP_037077252.1 uncharacterized protein LOC119098438 [Pollicipes pollicipes]XP_037077253.1 uncharacterized protein LOC119098438 [Pollic
MSAPTTRKSQWKNPCAIDQSLLLDGAGDMNMPTSSDAQILERIINLNRVVRPKVDELMEQFVRSTYHADQSEMLRDWGHHNMSWLGFVRATIDQAEAQLAQQDAADGGPSAISLGSALRTHFANLQRLAIGFEQMTVDAALYGDPNLDAFRRLQADLMQLLCELQIALLEKRLAADSSVTADIMGQDVRDMDSSRGRNLRNWVIIREYIMYLAHLDKVFGALRRRLPDE